MKFPHSFFEDEIRCDFVIPSMVKRTWAAQLEIIADLDEVCQKEGITYFAGWGTLLGAVRHGGFIPWDDDMDICMKRSDYNRFINEAASLMPEGHSIVNYRSNRNFKQMLSRIVSSDHYRFDPEYMKKYSGLPFALGIDIFPLDHISGDEAYEKDRRQRAELVYDVINEIAYFDTPLLRLEESLKEIERKCKAAIDRKGDVLTQLRELLEKIFAEVDEKDAEYTTLYPLWLNNSEFKFPAKYYKKSVRLPFENTGIFVPVFYDSILQKKYGRSYMRFERKGGAHEYPYYEKHLNILKEHFGFEWPAYRFDRSRMRIPDGEKKNMETCLAVSYCPAAFSNMRRVIKKYLSDGIKVTIHPAKSYAVKPDMSGIEGVLPDMGDEFYLKGLDGAQVSRDESLLLKHFDITVTNYPYDEYNLITAVDRPYYSEMLRSHTDHLVYVPAFEPSGKNCSDERSKKLMPSYVCTPLAVACDEIILKSDEQKERFVDCLTQFSSPDLTPEWSRKITVLEEEEKSDEGKKEEPGKKKIFFYIGIGSFAQGEEGAIKKLERVFDIFEKNKDRIDVITVMQEGLRDNLRSMFPHIYDMYNERGFSWDESDPDIENADAYYGEPSRYASEFVNAQKPVMIMNIDC